MTVAPLDRMSVCSRLTGLSRSSLDLLMPMHLILGPDGGIIHAGPTLRKILPDPVEGRAFFDLFHVQRPRSVVDVDSLFARSTSLNLRLRHAPGTVLKALISPFGADRDLPCGSPGGRILNMAFGITVVENVREFGLSNTDFAPTDLTIEMLYLVEAKSAAMAESRKLNGKLRGAKIAAEEQAFTDTLTGLKNRRAMNHVLDRLLRAGQDFSVTHLDLDYFKAVNDRYGHAAGDAVLQRVAQIMVEETRDQDTVARVGGDEFILIFDNLCRRPRLAQIAERLIDRIAAPIPFQGQTCRVAASLGTARSVDFARPDATDILAAADAALYSAKREGRSRHCFAPGGAGASGGGG